ncbi:MAG: DUF4034 domain-containing protein [Desulfobulbus sp.]|nr:DUF4034 domain-containing protein [Desulfobulbus sp.]
MKRITLLFLLYFVLFLPYNQLCQADTKQKSTDAIYDEIHILLDKKSFDRADAILQKILVSKKMSVDGLRVIEELYEKFSSIHDYELLNAWCNSSQNSHFPYSIRGGYYLQEAANARGTKYAKSVTEKQWEDMKKFLALAQADLEKSYALEPQDPYSAAEMIMVCLLTGYPREVMENWFNRAMQADNYWLRPYNRKMNYLFPQWYGKANEWQEFRKKCFYDAPKGSAVYSLIFDSLESRVRIKYFIVKEREAITNRTIDQETLGMIKEGIKRLKIDFPESGLHGYYEALLNINEDKYEHALTDIEKIIKKYPRIEKYIEAKIVLLFMLKKDDEAERELNNLFKINKDSNFALANIGSLKINKYNDIEGGTSNFRQIINHEQDDSYKKWYYYTLGNILFFKEKYDFAIDNFSKALDIDQEHTNSRIKRAHARHKIGDLDGAIEDMLIVKEDKKYKESAINSLDEYMKEKSEKNIKKEPGDNKASEIKGKKAIRL